MRLLHLTDTHLGVDRWYRGAPRGWRRADDHLAAMAHALDAVERGEVDAVVHTGDLFDRSHPPPRAVAAAVALLARAAALVPVLVLPGNHDRRGLRTHLRDPVPGLTVQDTPARIRLGDTWIGVVPWTPRADAWALAVDAVCADGVDVLVAHQGFEGSRVPGYTFRPGPHHPDVIPAGAVPSGVRTVLSGHIHTRQVFRHGDATVVHPGATERTALVERAETKGAAVWYADDHSVVFVDTPARPLHHVATTADLDPVGRAHLVHLAKDDASEDLEAAALARGAWVAPWAKPTRQARLF